MMRRVFFISLLPFIIVFSGACTRFEVPSLPQGDMYQIADSAERIAIVKSFAASREELRSFRGHGKLLLEHGLGSESLSQVFVFETPENLRVEFFATGLNRLAALLISRGRFLHAYDAVEGRVYRGEPSRANIENLLSVPFSPEELMYWLVGRLPVDIEEDCLEFDPLVSSEKRRVRFICVDEQRRTIQVVADLDVSKVSLAENRSERLPTPQIVYLAMGIGDEDRRLVTNYDYAPSQEGEQEGAEESLATKLEFWLPGPELKGNLTFISKELNPDLENLRNRLFTGSTPAGARIFNLESMNPEEIESLM